MSGSWLRAAMVALVFCALTVPFPEAQARSDSAEASKSKPSSAKRKTATVRKRDAKKTRVTTRGTKARTRSVRSASKGKRSVVRVSANKQSQATRRAIRRASVATPTIGQVIGLRGVDDPLDLGSSVALMVDSRTGETLFAKNADAVLPIASISKLLTAMVVIDSGESMGEMLSISSEDVDTERHSSSRLTVGTRLSRAEMLQLALMASENRAANALGRHHPGGMDAFVLAMNLKAKAIGMTDSSFVEPTGLSVSNVANAHDLAKLVRAAAGYRLLREYSTAPDLTVDTGYNQVRFGNTNRLVRAGWEIGVQKTGYISEAGRCLVMQTRVDGRPVIMVLLDSDGSHTRFGDARRLRTWLEAGGAISPPSGDGKIIQVRAHAG